MDVVTLADIVEGRAYGRKTGQYTLTYVRFEFLEVPPFDVWLRTLHGRQAHFWNRFRLRQHLTPPSVSTVLTGVETPSPQELAYERKAPRLRLR